MSEIIKVVETYRGELSLLEYDDLDEITIKIDDDIVFSVHEGENEDNSLNRNFNDCYSVADLMRQCYENGKNGNVMEFECVELDGCE